MRKWEGLPSPPIFTTGKLGVAGANRKDPVATPPGLPNSDLEPQAPQPPPPDSAPSPDSDMVFVSRVTPVAQSPSVGITPPSGFAGTSNDEHPVDPTIENAVDEEPPIEPMAIAPHETFYLVDGNVEVLCENKLFRVHTGTLSTHSPVLRQMLAQTNLDAEESPNDCPRILFPDTAVDFTTILKMIYPPGFFVPSACRRIVPLITRLPTDSPTGRKCRISSPLRPCSGSRQSTRCSPSDPGF